MKKTIIIGLILVLLLNGCTERNVTKVKLPCENQSCADQVLINVIADCKEIYGNDPRCERIYVVYEHGSWYGIIPQ